MKDNADSATMHNSIINKLEHIIIICSTDQPGATKMVLFDKRLMALRMIY